MSIKPSKRQGRSGAAPVTVLATGDLTLVLQNALELHRAGHLDKAAPLYEKVIKAEPQRADAWAYVGMLHFQRGELEHAQLKLRQAIELKPTVAAFHDQLGTVLEAAGRLEDALDAFNVAESYAGPADSDRRFNKGVVLGRLGRLPEAQAEYEEALEMRPKDPDGCFNLANLLKQQGQLVHARERYQQALESRPNWPQAITNLANTYAALKQWDEAVAGYQHALRLEPKDYRALMNLAGAHRERGDLPQAAAAYHRATQVRSESDPHLRLAAVSRQMGNYEAAARSYLQALTMAPSHRGALRGLAAVLGFLRPAGYRPDLERGLTLCYEAPAADPSRLAGLAAGQLRHKLGLGDSPPVEVSRLDEIVRRLDEQPLLHLMLRHSVNMDPVFEAWLVATRARLLEQARIALGFSSNLDLGSTLGGPASSTAPCPTSITEVFRFELMMSLAMQGHLNEYVQPVADAELAHLAAVRRVATEGEGRDGFGDETDRRLVSYVVFLTLGMYAAPELDSSQQVIVEGLPLPLHMPPDGCPDLSPLIRLTITEPKQERECMGDIPKLAGAMDPVTQAVRTQYVHSPYPRWSRLGTPEEMDYATELHQRFPHCTPLDACGTLDKVLVAGCGTGQEALLTALRRAPAEVWAVDLSGPSLAFAARKAREMKVRNLRFFEGDLRHVAQLNVAFDVVECIGVLHHLSEPMSGWRALKSVLRPGGLMKVGLYSRRARAAVNRGRQVCEELQLHPDLAGIRAIRRKVFHAPPEDAIASLSMSEDFYTSSSVRDLLFHECEHQYSMQEIAATLEALELEFLGFELSIPALERSYRAAYSEDRTLTDFVAWDAFEETNPDSFAAMYVFWCMARDSRSASSAQ